MVRVTSRIIVGDCRAEIAALPTASVQTCVTSPPYFGLRDYGVIGQIGVEETLRDYVAELVAALRGVRRVLAEDGTLWLNLGDSYAGSWGAQSKRIVAGEISRNQVINHPKRARQTGAMRADGAKPKDLYGVPWRVAFALQEDGWYLRSDIIWHKPNPMPESVTDRPTKSHEYVFLLSKSERYYYDADAIREPLAPASIARLSQAGLAEQTGSERAHAGGKTNGTMKAVAPRRSGNVERMYGADRGRPGSHLGGNVPREDDGTGRNARTVWTIPTRPFSGAHFATMPPELAERCVKAGSKVGDTVLDPFTGAGTTGLVASRLGRDFIGIELNPAYVALAEDRIHGDAPLFAEVSA